MFKIKLTSFQLELIKSELDKTQLELNGDLIEASGWDVAFLCDKEKLLKEIINSGEIEIY